jgi:hypothetical protein
VFRVNGSVDRDRENNSPAFLKANEGISPCRIVGREACTSNGDQTPTVTKTRQGRGDVPERASAIRRSTFASAENGGFIKTTLGTTAASRWSSTWAASNRVTVLLANS